MDVRSVRVLALVVVLACLGGARAQDATSEDDGSLLDVMSRVVLACERIDPSVAEREIEGGWVGEEVGRWPAYERDVAGPVGGIETAEYAEGIVQRVERWVEWVDRLGQAEVVHGVSSEGQRKAIWVAAWQTLRLTGSAMVAVDRVTERLDRFGGTAQERALLERLETSRWSVLPLRAARATVWFGSSHDDPALRRGFGELALDIVGGVEPLTAWARAERDIVAALAHLLAGEGEAAIVRLASAREALGADPRLSDTGFGFAAEAPVATVRAVLLAKGPDEAMVTLARLSDRPPFALADGERDWRLALLSADLRRLAVLAQPHKAGAAERERRLTRSILAYATLIPKQRMSEKDIGRRRADVYERLRRFMPSSLLIARLPGIALAAMADGIDSSKPSARVSMIKLLDVSRSFAEREGNKLDANVAFELGRLLVLSESADDRARGAEALLWMARSYPGDDRLGTALAVACAAARSAYDQAVAVGDGDLTRSRRALLLSCLQEAHGAGDAVEGVDAWRLSLGSILAADALRRSGKEMPTQARAASAVLGAIENASLAPAAWSLRLDLWRGVLERTAENLSETCSAEVEEARRSVDAAGEGDEEWGIVIAGADLLEARVHLAQRDPRKALDSLDSGRSGFGAGERLRIAYLTTRFEALVWSGALDEAFETLRALHNESAVDALRALDRVEGLAWSAVEPLSGEFPSDEVDSRVEESARVLGAALAWRGELGSPRTLAQRLRAGEALVHAGRGRSALGTLGAVQELRDAQPGLLVLLGEASLSAGDEAGAFDAFGRVAVALEPELTERRAYWHAWARMLEILARQNGNGSRTADMRREIERLMLTAGYDDYADCRERIDRVARSVGE